jgi:uncharacterized repeat protein (TIGR02543 family)
MTTILGNQIVETVINYLGGALNGCKFQFTGTTGTYTGSINVYLPQVDYGGYNRGVFGIYDVTSGAKIADSVEYAGLTASTWNTIKLTGTFSLVNNNWYWLVMQTPAGNGANGWAAGAWGSGTVSDQHMYVSITTKAYDGTLPSALPTIAGTAPIIVSIYASVDLAAPPPSQNAYVVVNAFQGSIPLAGAGVTLDGQSGTTTTSGTPLTFTVTAGTYTVTATYQNQTLPAQTITIVAGQTIPINLYFAVPTIQLTVTAGANGTVSPSGTASYTVGQSYMFTATPNSSYQLDHWQLGSSNIGSTNPLPLTITSAMAGQTLSPLFTSIPIPQITLSIAVSPDGGGTVSPSTGPHQFNVGDTVNFAATAGTGYTFTSWSLTGSAALPIDNPLSLVITSEMNNQTLTATFTAVTPPPTPNYGLLVLIGLGLVALSL